MIPAGSFLAQRFRRGNDAIHIKNKTLISEYPLTFRVLVENGKGQSSGLILCLYLFFNHSCVRFYCTARITLDSACFFSRIRHVALQYMGLRQGKHLEFAAPVSFSMQAVY